MTAVEHAEAMLGILAGLLAYALIVQALMAAVLLLAQFTVLQWRSLRSLLTVESTRPESAAKAEPQPEAPLPNLPADQGKVVVLGGGIRKWE
jgi:predicted lipid-binding transport protein (Tim44 family)